MARFEKLSKAEKAPETKHHLEDPDETLRKKERADKVHKNWMSLLGMVPVLIKAFVFFLIILFIVILPVTEMTLCYINFWDGFQDWARAFVSTAGTLGVAIATIAIPTVLGYFYRLIKKHSSDED